MLARRNRSSLVFITVTMVLAFCLVALYELMAANRFHFVVALLLFVIFVLALLNVSLNKRMAVRALNDRGRRSKLAVGDFHAPEDSLGREVVLFYRDFSRGSSAINTISMSVAPGDRVSFVVQEGNHVLVSRK